MSIFGTKIDHFNGFLSYMMKTFNILNQFVHHSKSVIWWKCNEVLIWLWKMLPEVLFFSYISTFWFSKIFGVLQRNPKHFQKMSSFVLKFGSNLICVFLFCCITHCFLLSQLEHIHTYEWISKAKTCFVKSTQTGRSPNVHSDWKLERTSNIFASE